MTEYIKIHVIDLQCSPLNNTHCNTVNTHCNNVTMSVL